MIHYFGAGFTQKLTLVKFHCKIYSLLVTFMVLLFLFRSVRGEMNPISCLQKVCYVFLLTVKIFNSHYKNILLFETSVRLQIFSLLKNDGSFIKPSFYLLPLVPFTIFLRRCVGGKKLIISRITSPR